MTDRLPCTCPRLCSSHPGSGVTAAAAGATLSAVFAPADRVVANVTTRTIGGIGVRYNVLGRTSRGPLRVRDVNALTYPADLSRVILTREHDRGDPRGILASLEHTTDGTRVAFRVADGPAGDDALREAADGTRAALSFDIVDAVIDGDTIVAGNVIAFGQCAIPAFDDARIDTIAAAAATTEGNPIMLSPEQAARLLELQGRIDGGETLSAEEQAEYDALNALNQVYNSSGGDSVDAGVSASSTPNPQGVTINISGQPAPGVEVAASIPAVPGGVGGPGSSRPPARTAPAGNALRTFYETVARALAPTNPTRVADVTAALSDITNTANTAVDRPAWSGELWSGLLYEPQWSDLFTSGELTSWSGDGWRFTNKLEIADYAGDKAAIPTDTVTTESSSYTAARMAVGVDIDRKFFDFPSVGFVESLFSQVRESWEMKLDAKIRAYVLANDVAAVVDESNPASAAVAAQPSLLKAAAVAVRALKRRNVGKASFVYVNDDDLFDLLDIAEKDVPVFLDLYGIDPRNFRSDDQIPAGTVLAGVKPAATVRTLPGSPIRVEAQNLANGGVDEAFFGYWAIEEHHTRAIASATYTAPA